jgi:hypothetical protein
VIDHDAHQIREKCAWLPAELPPGLRSVAPEVVYLGRPQVAGVDDDVLLPLKVQMLETATRNPRTECDAPVAITKSSGSGCCGISHIASPPHPISLDTR